MQLPITATNPLSAPSSQATGRGLPWRAGAVLQAVVLEASLPGQVALQIGSQTITARTLFPMTEGQVLSLRVSHTGELVVLRQDNAAAATAEEQQTSRAITQQALREALPRQAPLAPLLANLTLIAREPARFPAALVDAARAALSALPDSRDVAEPDTLERSVQRSGLWLEASLAGGEEIPDAPAALARDWKGALLRLGASLRELATSAGAPSGSTPRATSTQPPVTAQPSQSAATADAPPAASPAAAKPGVVVASVVESLAEATRVGAATAASIAATDVDSAPESVAAEPSTAGATGSDAARGLDARASDVRAADAAPLLRAGAVHPQPRAEASLAQAVLASDDAQSAQHLLRQVEGALARVELGQLASLRADDSSGQVWWLELPVRAEDGETDVLQLRIEREGGSGGGEEQPAWSVSLAFDLGELGPVRARVAVRGELVSTLFFAERDATVARLRAGMGALEQAFTRRGLKVGTCGCRAGSPGPAADPAADGHPLLAVQA